MLKDILSGFVALFQSESYDGVDRRKVIRLRCRYSVYVLYKKQILTATAVDMGLQGIRLDVREKLKKGTPAVLLYRGAVGQKPVLTLPDIQRDLEAASQEGVHCEVTWCHQDRYSKKIQAGVRYVDTPQRMSRSWVKKILREIGFDESTIFQRRKIVRVMASIPYETRTPDGPVKGLVLNLGAGGALLQSDSPLPTILKLHIGPYKNMEYLNISGKVVTCRHEPTSNSFLQGIRFQGTTPAEVELLGKYIMSLLKDNMV
ncbi:MAG: PilZ domain-containing protein [Candidatus Eremiobacteraeota bacterium]|nr:PilZ domain-containing protein [Candidatus Eremiobacteraeota bacterium]